MKAQIELELLQSAITALESSPRKHLRVGGGSAVSVKAIDDGSDWGLSLPVFSPAGRPQLLRTSKDGKALEYRYLPCSLREGLKQATLKGLATALREVIKLGEGGQP